MEVDYALWMIYVFAGFVCTHPCDCVDWLCMSIYGGFVPVHVEIRDQTLKLFLRCHLPFNEAGSLIRPGVITVAGLDGQQALGICLSEPPQ